MDFFRGIKEGREHQLAAPPARQRASCLTAPLSDRLPRSPLPFLRLTLRRPGQCFSIPPPQRVEGKSMAVKDLFKDSQGQLENP